MLDAQVAHHYLSDRAGFDETARKWTLQHANGNSEEGVNQESLLRLVDMGFSKPLCIQALKDCEDDESRAIERLLG